MATNLYTKTYYDISRFVIWGDEDSGTKSRMVFSFRDGNPRITVYIPTTSQTTVVSFPCDTVNMVSILNYIKEAANSEPGYKVSVDSLTSVYEDNKPTKDKKLVSTLHIGKSMEGLVYLSVIAPDKPKVVFTIKPSEYHVFRDKDKQNISVGEVSKRMAIGIADLMLNIIADILVKYTEEEYRTQANGKKLTTIRQQPQTAEVVNSKTIEELDL